jgi:protein-tyrosine phosphatase
MARCLSRNLAAEWAVVLAIVAASIFAAPPACKAFDAPTAERVGPRDVRVHWWGGSPIDIFVANDPGAPMADATLVARSDTKGVYDFTKKTESRPYFILINKQDGSVQRAAERLLPLERGSNFRDLGGYPAGDGKHVRWGIIYRTAAMPMLTENDYRYLGKLGIKADVDLRSTDEQVIAPDPFPQHTGSRYFSNQYSFAAPREYPDLPTTLAPQFRTLFRELLRRDGAVVFHCSAGQDRTGVAAALVLSALGVPRNEIVQDYLISTQWRRPQYELAQFDPSRFPGNSYAEFIAELRATNPTRRPYPLYDAAGVPYLDQTFDEIDRRWGDVFGYFREILNIDQDDIARLRASYLE